MYHYLVVDDEPMIRYSIRYLLETSGLPVKTIYEAENGEGALEILQEYSVDYALIDINMPKMNGLELARQISRRYANTVMCIVSGYDDFNYARQAMQFGVRAYLLKPLNSEELKSTLLQMMEEKNSQDRQRLRYDDFNRHVEAMFNRIKRQEREDVRAEVKVFLAAIEGFTEQNHIEVMNELIIELYERIAQAIGEQADGQIVPAAFGRPKREQWLDDRLQYLLELMAGVCSSPYYKIIENARQQLLCEGGWNISLEELAGKLGVNASYFSRIFREETGMTFIAYRTNLRMKRACDLLENLEKSIAVVAYEVGYHDVTHFIRVFKKHMGVAPSVYRKRIKS